MSYFDSRLAAGQQPDDFEKGLAYVGNENGDDDVKGDAQYYESIAGMLNTMPERVIRYKVPELTIVHCNASWADGFGLQPSEVVGRNLTELLTPFEIGVLRSHLELFTPENLTIVNGAHAPNDPSQWIDWVDRYIPGTDADHGAAVMAVGRDATQRHVAELKLLDSEARFRELADRSADVVWRFRVNPRPHFDYMSPAVEHILGYPRAWFLDDFTHFVDILDDDGRALVAAAVEGRRPVSRTDLRFRCADGRIVIGETVTTALRSGLQGISRDVTELRALQDSLASLALRDPLTGLANRRLLDELLGQSLARVQSSGEMLSVAFLDLDRFKTVNDTYGHEAGDAVLCETARRLLGVVRSGDVVARLGGDEFVIVCEIDRLGAEHLVSRIEAALAVPMVVNANVSVVCPVSVGLADTLSGCFRAADLVAAADAAMYEVKKSLRSAQHR